MSIRSANKAALPRNAMEGLPDGLLASGVRRHGARGMVGVGGHLEFAFVDALDPGFSHDSLDYLLAAVNTLLA